MGVWESLSWLEVVLRFFDMVWEGGPNGFPVEYGADQTQSTKLVHGSLERGGMKQWTDYARR